MTTWQERLKVERDELRDKLDKLNEFIINDTNLNDIPAKHQALLISQVYAMTQYLDILNMRLTYANNNK